jgi:hypothetical protein
LDDEKPEEKRRNRVFVCGFVFICSFVSELLKHKEIMAFEE